MKFTITRKVLFLTTLLTLSALVLSGCFRKHIESAPPARRPATTAATTPAPAPKPTVVEETPVLIEETYIVDAPEEAATPVVKIEEDDLDAEPAAATIEEEAAVTHQQKVKEAKDAVEQAPVEAAKPVTLGELYYVQVGAFSDLVNANGVLASLLEQGYTGTKMAKTESGLYRIQAGAFTDQEAANAALSKLLSDYPKGFVVKGMPEE